MTVRVLDAEDRGSRDYEKGAEISVYDGTLSVLDSESFTIVVYAPGTWSRAYVVEDVEE